MNLFQEGIQITTINFFNIAKSCYILDWKLQIPGMPVKFDSNFFYQKNTIFLSVYDQAVKLNWGA